MATQFDTTFRKVAQDLIGLFGVTTTAGEYTSVTLGAFNVDTGEPANTEDVQNLNMSPPLKFKKRDVDGQVIQTDRTQIIIAGEDWDAVFSVQPKTNDIIKVNGLAFRVIYPNPIYSGTLIAAYKLEVKAGHAQ